MSSRAPSDDELVNLLNNVLTETPMVGVDGSRGGRNREVGQIGDNVGRHVQVNRLTFAEEVTQSAQGKQSEMVAGTSNRDIDSLYIDLTSSGMESSDGGFQMLSARSSGSSTIDSTGVDHTPLVYDIYRFPLTEQEMVGMCNQRQSGGITACIRANCKLNHRGPKLAFQPGSIMVARSGASVFLEPVTSHRNVSEGLLTELKKTPRVLDEWNELFRILNNQEPSQVFTPSLLEDFRVYDKFAKDWKSSSPTKSDTVDSSPLRLVKSSVFVQIVGEETTVLKELFRQEVLMLANEEARDPAPILKTGEWSYDEAFKKLESDVGINTSVINKVTIKLDEVADKVNEEFKVLFTRIESVECTIGPKVIPRNPTLDAPTVWSSIALVASAIDDIQSEILSVKAKNIEYITALELRLTKVLEEQLQEFVDSTVMAITDQEAEGKIRSDRVLKMIDGTKESILMLARGASKLKEEMDELRTAFHMIPVPEAGGTAATEDSSVLSDISSIKVMIRSLGQRIDTVVDGRETKAIKFFGTTFRGHSEAELWVLEHLDNDSFGLIVDVHLVFEHIYQQAFNDEGALKELNGLYKIKIDNLTQGLAMTSFDHPMPKFFSVAVNAVNKKPKIGTYLSWVLELLEEFQDTHMRMIGEAIPADDPAYRVATMSVQASVNWIQSFITYLDETYSETFRLPSFTTARAWQLVTQIGRRILNDVAAPRNGVKKLFRVGDNMKIAQTMFWPMVQSHELMNRFKKANFRDDPSVSNEFMKFMATNSGSTDGLAPLHTKITKLEGDLKSALTASKGATTSATNSANKADEIKRLLTSLIQRVTILEKSK